MSSVNKPPTIPTVKHEEPELRDGSDLDVPCPKCGAGTRVRTNRDNGSRFMGCMQYPECNGTTPIPAFQRMKALGHPTLPGF